MQKLTLIHFSFFFVFFFGSRGWRLNPDIFSSHSISIYLTTISCLTLWWQIKDTHRYIKHPHNSSFKSLVLLSLLSSASELSDFGADVGFWSLKGIDAFFLMNLYKATTVRSVSTVTCQHKGTKYSSYLPRSIYNTQKEWRMYIHVWFLCV